EKAECEGDAGLRREHRMAGDEDESEQVVADVVVDRILEIRHGQFPLQLELASELFVLALQERAATEVVDGAVLGGGHEPRPGPVRDAGLGPAFERGNARLLGDVLRQTDDSHDPREAGDEARRLDPPDRFDGAMGLGIGHGLRSQHLPPLVQESPQREPKCSHSLPSQHGPISRTSTVAHSVAGHSLAMATASSLVAQSRRKKPPTISFASANGPSTTLRLPPRTLMRTPVASDVSESHARSTPFASRPSLYRAMLS